MDLPCPPQMANHLWQSTLFVVLAGILALALRKNQARVRYWIWMTASAKFLIPFSLLIAVGSHLARPRVYTPAQMVVYSAVENLSQPFAGQKPPVFYQAAQSRAQLSTLDLLPATVVAAWLAGIVVVVLMWLTSWIRVSLMERRAVPLSEGPEVEALRRMESSFGVGTPIKLVLSRNWMEPGIFGIFRPVLIWPEGLSRHLDNRHIEAILAHEVCHARRHDNLTAVLHMMIETIFWFHPPVWWVGAKLEEERERACDEEVGLLCRQPRVYAESILRVCKFCSESPLACLSGITGADLKRRVLQIMTERVVRKLAWKKKLLIATVGVCVAAVPIFLGEAKAAQQITALVVNRASSPLQPLENTGQNAVRSQDTATQEAPNVAARLSETSTVDGAEAAAPAMAQAAPAPQAISPVTLSEMRFEGASIRPSPPDDNFMHAPGGTAENFSARMATVESMIGFAYNIPFMMEMSADPGRFFLPHASNLIGGPSWVSNDRYDLTAKADAETVQVWGKLPKEQQKEELRSMMRALLEDRFHLTMRHETRNMPVWALVVAKGGPKFAEAVAPPADLNDGSDPAKPYDKSKPYQTRWKQDRGLIQGRDVSIDDLGWVLWGQRELESRKILDQTGLKGKYDLTLKWASTDDPREPDGPSLFTAIQEQLGLKLEATKRPMDVLVIDHVERPSEN
jgi:bla regulator protein blaR1